MEDPKVLKKTGYNRPLKIEWGGKGCRAILKQFFGEAKYSRFLTLDQTTCLSRKCTANWCSTNKTIINTVIAPSSGFCAI